MNDGRYGEVPRRREQGLQGGKTGTAGCKMREKDDGRWIWRMEVCDTKSEQWQLVRYGTD